jgi:hypothetical protein
MSIFRRRIISKRWILSINATNFIRPIGDLNYISVTGGNDELSVLAGSNANFELPTSVKATYYNIDTNGTIIYKGFVPSISSSNNSIITIGTPSDNSCTFTCKGAGSADIIVKYGSVTVQKYTITVKNAPNEFEVINNVEYISDNTNIIQVLHDGNEPDIPTEPDIPESGPRVEYGVLYLNKGAYDSGTVIIEQGSVQGDTLVL